MGLHEQEKRGVERLGGLKWRTGEFVANIDLEAASGRRRVKWQTSLRASGGRGRREVVARAALQSLVASCL